MQFLFRKRTWLAAAVVAALSIAVGTVFAHEGREVGDYSINIGWIVEPAYEGVMNGVEVRVTRVTVSGADDHGESMSSTKNDDARDGMAMADHHGGAPVVEGLENTLQVEVVYVPTGASRVVNLSEDVNEAGRYTAALLPTTPGVYEFRVFGAIEGMQVDETFASRGAAAASTTSDRWRPSSSRRSSRPHVRWRARCEVLSVRLSRPRTPRKRGRACYPSWRWRWAFRERCLVPQALS